jgi:hypothetical protein
MPSFVVIQPLQLPAGRDLSEPHITKGITCSNRLVSYLFSKENQVQTYMHARINFHEYSWHKCIQKQYHIRKREIIKDLRLILETKAPNSRSSRLGGYVCLEPATSSQDFRVASSFWATLFIERVSTCRTQQVWGKNECKCFIVDWAISI